MTLVAPGVVVVLTWPELELAAYVGIRRRVESIRAGLVERFDPKQGDPWGRDIRGACAELAFAKWRGVYWGGHVNVFRVPDVGLVEVKHTEPADGYLPVADELPPDHVLVLVTGTPPTLTIRGWARAGDFQHRTEFGRLNHDRLVPARFLRPLEELGQEEDDDEW